MASSLFKEAKLEGKYCTNACFMESSIWQAILQISEVDMLKNFESLKIKKSRKTLQSKCGQRRKSLANLCNSPSQDFVVAD
jgi:hypothetical protein